MPPAPHPADVRRELVDALAGLPVAVSRLRAAHLADDSGRWCRVCQLGAQAGHHRWPCRLRGLADAAQQLIERRARERFGPGAVFLAHDAAGAVHVLSETRTVCGRGRPARGFPVVEWGDRTRVTCGVCAAGAGGLLGLGGLGVDPPVGGVR